MSSTNKTNVTSLQPNPQSNADTAAADFQWRSLYTIAGAATLVAVLFWLSDVVFNFLPGGEAVTSGSMTVLDWFKIYQQNAFLGLRGLGLWNVITLLLLVPVFLAFYHLLRRTSQTIAALSVVFFLLGAGIYIANNPALSMLTLSRQYAVAADSQKTILAAAGQVLLSSAEDFTPGTFTGFFLTELAGILMAALMLRSRIFGRATALVVLLGYGFLLLFTIIATFAPSQYYFVLPFSILGGLLEIAAYILIAIKLFRLAKETP